MTTPKTCGAMVGPEGDRCAIPSPCREHEPAQTMEARIVELEGHRTQWRRRAAQMEDTLRAVASCLGDEHQLRAMATAALQSAATQPNTRPGVAGEEE